jgi:hypothetical protein
MFAAMSNVAKPDENTGQGDRALASGRETGAFKTHQSASSDVGLLAGLVAAVTRIEQRQTVHEQVALRVVDMLAIHNEKLDAIIEAATQDPGPSPVAEALAAILSSLREQETLLAELPAALAETIRDVWLRALDAEDEPDTEDPETESAGPPGAFDDRTNERH